MNDDFGENTEEEEGYYSLESEDDYGRSEIHDRDGKRQSVEFDGGRTGQLSEEQRQAKNRRGDKSLRRGVGSIYEEQKRSSGTEIASNGRIAYVPMADDEVTNSISEDIEFGKKHGIRVYVVKENLTDLKRGIKARGYNSNKTDIYYNGDKRTFEHELCHSESTDTGSKKSSTKDGEENVSEDPQTLGKERPRENNDSVWERSDDTEGIYKRVGVGTSVLRRGKEGRRGLVDWSGKVQSDSSSAREAKRTAGILREISKRRIANSDALVKRQNWRR